MSFPATDPNIDFVTVHIYNDENTSDVTDTFAVAYAVDKPIIVEETGLDSGSFGDRPTTLTNEMNLWMDQWEARGVMQWGYQVQNYDIGDGDLIFGMDPNVHSGDWAGMNTAYSSRATSIANNPVTVEEILPPTGDNLSLTAVNWSAYEQVIYNTIAFEVQTGPTLSGPWTTRFSHSDNHAPNRVIGNFSAPVDAQFVRLLITDAGTDNYARIPEFEVYGTAPSVSDPQSAEASSPPMAAATGRRGAARAGTRAPAW